MIAPVEDLWLGSFPAFSRYKKLWIAKRNGPVLTGVLLDVRSAKTEYYPIYHLTNMVKWGWDSSAPGLENAIYFLGRYGSRQSVRFSANKETHLKVIGWIQRNVLLPIDESSYSKKQVYRVFEQYDGDVSEFHRYLSLISLAKYFSDSSKVAEYEKLCRNIVKSQPSYVVKNLGGEAKLLKILEELLVADIGPEQLQMALAQMKLNTVPDYGIK